MAETKLESRKVALAVRGKPEQTWLYAQGKISASVDLDVNYNNNKQVLVFVRRHNTTVSDECWCWLLTRAGTQDFSYANYHFQFTQLWTGREISIHQQIHSYG
jgi:hypothetical protein